MCTSCSVRVFSLYFLKMYYGWWGYIYSYVNINILHIKLLKYINLKYIATSKIFIIYKHLYLAMWINLWSSFIKVSDKVVHIPYLFAVLFCAAPVYLDNVESVCQQMVLPIRLFSSNRLFSRGFSSGGCKVWQRFCMRVIRRRMAVLRMRKKVMWKKWLPDLLTRVVRKIYQRNWLKLNMSKCLVKLKSSLTKKVRRTPKYSQTEWRPRTAKMIKMRHIWTEW